MLETHIRDSFVADFGRSQASFTASLWVNRMSPPSGNGAAVSTEILIAAGIDFMFTPTLSWVNLIQYDNVTETAGIYMRFHWIPEAGPEVYFVINHNVEDHDSDNPFRSTASDMTAKLNYTFRF